MLTDAGEAHPGVAMQIVGALIVVVAVPWLFAVDEPSPMWLIVAGGGVMFLGVGAAVRERRG
jgi:hypothetical protein